MPEEPSGDWDAARYQREKRNFIASRALLRPITLHAGVIFALTGLAGWGTSGLLLLSGLRHMALRYAIAFGVAYLVFALAVRVWADFLRQERKADWTEGGWDFPAGGDGEGCLLVLAALAIGLLAASLVTLLGGVPLLLEVAFEVVFAGVVVRRLGRRETIGDWRGRLLRNTWLPALAIALVLVIVAAWLQHRAPEARTLPEAVRSVWGARAT